MGIFMLNYLWAGMMAIGIIWGAMQGNLEAVTNGALDSAKEAVTLCITMLGIMSFWNGILEIGSRAGLIEQMAGKMRPLLKFLFPRVPNGHPAQKEIATNMIANILGLGWAATPAGLRAMKELEALEEEHRNTNINTKISTNKNISNSTNNSISNGVNNSISNGISKSTVSKTSERVKKNLCGRGVASNEMCTFLIINISSLQLIPVNMIAYRSQYGSSNPTAIVGPAIIATMVSTVTAVLFCKIMDGKISKKQGNS